MLACWREPIHRAAMTHASGATVALLATGAQRAGSTTAAGRISTRPAGQQQKLRCPRWCHTPWAVALVLTLLPTLTESQQPHVKLFVASPRRVPVEMPTTVTITGSGFGTPSSTARCRIGPPPAGGSTVVQASGYGGPNDANADLTFNATIINDTTAQCTVPAVVVGGPVVLSLSVNGAAWAAPFWWVNALELTYFELIDVAVGRRPYIAEHNGSLLVYTDQTLAGVHLHVAARLPCAGRQWVWQYTPTAAQRAVELVMDDISSLPATINSDLIVQVVSTVVSTTKARRLMRAPPLNGSSTVEPVAVDHLRRQISVAGSAFMGTGWMMDGHRPLALRNLSAVTLEVERIAAAGTNQVMLYSLPLHSPSSVQRFLDTMQSRGVKVWVDLQPLGFSGAGGDNYESRWEDQAWHEAVRGNVSLVMHHRAVLGYYICDDCCPLDGNIGNVTLQARFYNLIKSIDPYHLTTGAIQCNANTWIWSDVPAGIDGHSLPGGINASAPSPPAANCNPDPGHQPLLQLSLDLLLVENYAATMRSHAHDGSWSDGGGKRAKVSIEPGGIIAGDVNTATDGAWRHGVRWEPLGNIGGLWQSVGPDGRAGGFERFPASPQFSSTALWLGAIEAGMSSVLMFMIQDWNYGGGRPGCLVGVDCWPVINWWSQEAAVHNWMAHARALAPSLHAPITLIVPDVALTAFTPLRLPMGGGGDPYEPRMRVWREDCSAVCLHLVVANVMTHTPVHFSAQLGGAGWQAIVEQEAATSGISNATRIFEAQYTIPISSTGELDDWIDAGSTNVYEIGCNGPRPVASEQWQECSSRRGHCTQGWTDKPGGQCGDD